MPRRALIAILLAAALCAPASQALASSPSVLVAISTTADRFRPDITITYTGAVTVADTDVSLHRKGSTAQVPLTVSGSGSSVITISVAGTLASAATYDLSVTPAGDSLADTAVWKTRAAPAHPKLRVKLVTALDPQAVADIAHRLDRANLLAVPRPSDLVDISAAALLPHALADGDLKGYQAALVATDRDVYSPGAAAAALTWFASNGHGVVLGGQTHWTSGGLWTALSAIGGSAGHWATDWSPLPYIDPPAIEGGALKASSVQSHFLTRNLSDFHVHGSGSGAQFTQSSWNEQVLARLQPSATYAAGQTLLAVHREDSAFPGRVVDLGFNPWSTDVASGGGGYDPVQTPQAAPLVARALWWACDRIAPTNSHFTSKPRNPSPFRTVSFSMAAKDADPGSSFASLRFQYRLNAGSWRSAAGGTSFVLYHLPAGRTYTVRIRAVDFAGNKDAHPALYRFRVAAGATG